MSENQSSFTYDELISCGHGDMFGEGNAQLPLPPMLMFDRITHISKEGGLHGKGEITAELDVKPSLWFFNCHFEGDPVMPGCLGLDALWQMVGFFLGWNGGKGRGRAIGVGEVRFQEMIVPTVKKLTYQIDFRRVINRRLILGIGDGIIKADGEVAFTANDLRVGLFSTESGS